jgi:probable O-glycosylation ligase (exosortase A-associated)
MGAYLIWKSPGRWKLAFAAAIMVPVLLMFMPSTWYSRMDTIGSYEQDASAMGRINAWWFAFNVAKDRPLVGGGFGTFNPELFERFAPVPEDFHDAHSIYFEVLAEQGFVGLTLFLLLWWFVFSSCRAVDSLTKGRQELQWAANLCRMVQVSLFGYAVSGAFLGMAYFDLVYCLIAIVVLTRSLVEQHLVEAQAFSAEMRPAPFAPAPRVS